MQEVTADDATRALQLLGAAAAKRDQDLEQYAEDPYATDSDSDGNSSSPILDQFLIEGGSEAVHQMTNFSLSEFDAIWEIVKSTAESEWNSGRGRKSSFQAKDVLFMTMTVLKHSGTWDFLGRMFKIKGPTFERMIMSFIEIICQVLYQEVVVAWEKKYTMTQICRDKTIFKYHRYALYASDVTFQHTNRPSGNHDESKRYFSNKHKLYGYKVEASVLPNGLCIGCTPHYPGSVSDLQILRDNIEFHQNAMSKTPQEVNLADKGALMDEYSDSWAVILDKGYQGAANTVRAILPVKKPKGGVLSTEDERKNRKVAHDRIIVENFFGRMCVLWIVIGSKYRWDEKNYDRIFKLCTALTNMHIKWHPLRDEDGKVFEKYKKRMLSIGEDITAKRKRTQAEYRARRRARLALEFSGLEHEAGAGAGAMLHMLCE